MTTDLEQALARKAAAEQIVAEATQEIKTLALAQLEAALEACRAAGVRVPTHRQASAPRSEEARRRMSAAAKARWSTKTPEERAAWGRTVSAALAAKRGSIETSANGAAL